jgi:predicted RNase H-like HicB family nuclease
MKSKKYDIHAFWDAEASVWVAESKDVKGLVTEAASFEELREKLKRLIPELLEANGIKTEKYIEYRVTTNFHETIPA